MKKILSTMLIALVLVLNVLPIAAEGAQSESESVPYNIEPVVSDLQLNKSAGYFHLQVTKDTKEKLQIKVNNNGDQETVYEIRADIGKTNKNGLIVYREDNAKGPNDTLEYNIEDFISIKDKVITVPAHSTKNFEIDIDLKGKTFDGILAGAFTVNEVLEESDTAGIGHVYLYELGILLTQSDDAALPNSKTLDLGEVEMTLDAGHKVLSYDILNLEPNIARNLNIETKLTKTDEEEVIFDEKVEKFSIAPNGILPLRLDWKRNEVKPGSYLLEIDVEDGEEAWSWTYEFTIDKDEAKDLNENATYIVRYPSWTFTAFVVLGILTIVNTLYLVKRQIDYEKDKGEAKKNEREKQKNI